MTCYQHDLVQFTDYWHLATESGLSRRHSISEFSMNDGSGSVSTSDDIIDIKDESDGVYDDQDVDGDDDQNVGSAPSQGLHRNFSFEQKIRVMKVGLNDDSPGYHPA